MTKKFKVNPEIILMGVLAVGIGVFLLGFFESPIITQGDVQLTTPLEIISVPIDPFTGGVLGDIVIGAPDIIPFDQAGTYIGTDVISRTYPQNRCSNNLTGGTTFPILAPDFGRRLSGERNQPDPIFWGSKSTGITDTYNCAFAYASWDTTEIPNGFVATSVAFKVEVLEARGIRNTNNPPQDCFITIHNDFDVDFIGQQALMDRLFPRADTGVIPSELATQTTSWCRTTGIKTLNFGQVGVDMFNEALTNGQDQITLGFTPAHLNNLGTGNWKLSTEYWKTEGSWIITGSSPPISCDIGFVQSGFRCVPLVCASDEKINPATNTCELVVCSAGENLEIIEAPTACTASIPPICTGGGTTAVCTPIQCQIGETLVNGFCQTIVCEAGTHLVGTTCDPLFCDTGFEISGNQCVLKTCGTGLELVGDECQPIVCPINTVLSGNNCVERVCPAGQISINNECTSKQEFDVVTVDDPSLCPFQTVTVEPIDGRFDCLIEKPLIIQCDAGFQQVGDQCNPIILDCPLGTIPQQNICIQIFPDLLQLQDDLPFVSFIILGLVIIVISLIAIIARRRR
jgi:hypothetical protein